MNKIFASANFITFIAIGVIWALTWIMARNTYGFVPAENLQKSALLSVLVAFSIGLILEAQKQQLSKVNEQLWLSRELLRKTLIEMETRAEMDSLTRVLNHGSFLEKLELMHNAGSDGVLLMIDADDFKSVNDCFGHASGDHALRLIAETISTIVGRKDLVGRLGGEEFAVFLNGADPEMAKVIANHLCASIAQVEFWPTPSQRHQLSVSIGGELLTSHSAVATALATADEQLYAAKNLGKNRYEFRTADGAVERGALLSRKVPDTAETLRQVA